MSGWWRGRKIRGSTHCEKSRGIWCVKGTIGAQHAGGKEFKPSKKVNSFYPIVEKKKRTAVENERRLGELRKIMYDSGARIITEKGYSY